MDELTTGEKLTVLRRRKNLNQEDVAAKYHVTQATVSYWEKDEIPFPGKLKTLELTEGEECYLLRRRLGLRLKDTAKNVGVSHVTLIKWEKENPPDNRYLRYLLKQEEKSNE